MHLIVKKTAKPLELPLNDDAFGVLREDKRSAVVSTFSTIPTPVALSLTLRPALRVRSAAAGLYRYGVTANAIAPVARTRMSANVPSELAEMGDPEDVAPMVVYLLSDRARHVTGQVYTVVGSKIAVWNQPAEVRAMWAAGRWTPEQIAERLDGTVGQERMELIDRREQMRAAAASGEKPNA